MLIKKLTFITGILALGAANNARAEILELCNIRIESSEKISFSSTEEKWLCGDPDSNAWKSIPISQQRAWLASFLQNRGYHHQEIAESGGKIFVSTGKKSIVERFTVEGAPQEWNWAKRRLVKGAVLDPAHLNVQTSWAKRALQDRGYPCPKVEAKAFLDTNELLISVIPGPKQRFGPVQSQGTSDMDPRILERFTAFAPEDFFDMRMLELTSERILREDLYLSTFYDIACDEQQVATITRRFVPAAPRLLTFGAGFDTERGPIGRVRWKRTRLTKKADSLEASAFVSFRQQQLEAKYRNHFPSDPSSRLEFDPTIRILRESEKTYETISYQVEPVLGYAWPNQTSDASARFGPVVRHTETRRGLAPEHRDSLRLVADFGFMSRLFDYYSSNPQKGWNVGFEAWTQIGGVFGQKSIHKLMFRQEALWNLGEWEPPLFVLGWRGYQGTFFFHKGEQLRRDVPAIERFFLGGDDDIRGFARKGLPGDDLGYLTIFYQGLELRVVEWLPFSLQPFLFLDVAKGGRAAQEFDSPFFYAPGVGVRWPSPIGTIRATLARGFASREEPGSPAPNLQFFLSFGKEF